MNSANAYWTPARKRCWAVLGGAVCAVWGLVLAVTLAVPKNGRLNDFVQEWSSARRYFEGEPIYGDLRPFVARHFGKRHVESLPIEVNGHPPASVLLTLPFGWLSYRAACLVWNLLSLVGLVAGIALILGRRGLNCSAWAWLPILACLLPSGPFADQVMLVQMSLLLFFLLTAAWWADRNGHAAGSGCLVGLAASLKLFPGFLLLYFAAQRRWKSVAAAAITMAALHAAAWAVLGRQAFSDYITIVLPSLGRFEVGAFNASLAAWWSRLLDGAHPQFTPLANWPLLAGIATAVSVAAAAALAYRTARRAGSAGDRDLAFSLCVAAMMLATPIVWWHYFLMLILPLIVLWRTASAAIRPLLAATTAVLAINPYWFARFPWIGSGLTFDSSGQVAAATLLNSLTVLSFQLYALVALFLLIARQCHGHVPAAAATAGAQTDGGPKRAGVRRAGLRGMLRPTRAFLALQAVIVTAGAAWAAFDIADHMEQRRLPPLRNRPRLVAPRYNDPAVVTDAQLRQVLARLAPRFRGKASPVSTIDHALRFWGVEATLADRSTLGGRQMRRLLTDQRAFRAYYGKQAPPLLQEADHGLRVRTQEDQYASSHIDHTLACLAEVGTPLDFPLRTGRRSATLRSVLEQSLHDFSLNQFEYEWSALAYALYFESPGEWTTREGQRMSFDRIADRIMRQEWPQGVCRGQHRFHALVMLLRVDEQERMLTAPARQRIEVYLRRATRTLMATQRPGGCWGSDWYGSRAVASDDKPEDERQVELLVTGHVLEWWSLAPADVLPPRENVVRAAQWFVGAIERLEDGDLVKHYGPLSHGGRALSLWRGRWPHEWLQAANSASPSAGE